MVTQRELAAGERADEAQGIAGFVHRQREKYAQETAGQLEGFACLSPELCLREILTKGLDPLIERLGAAEVDSLQAKELVSLSWAATSVDGLLQRLREAVQHGKRLLRRSNILQLSRYADRPEDALVMRTFLETLPDD